MKFIISILLPSDDYGLAILLLFACYSMEVCNMFSVLCYLKETVFTAVYFTCLPIDIVCLLLAYGSAFSVKLPTLPVEQLIDSHGLLRLSIPPQWSLS
jgi:hypothetical protein